MNPDDPSRGRHHRVDDEHGGTDAGRETREPALPPESGDSPRKARRAERREALSPSASLSPGERVFPTWTDPTVRSASTLIGGPLGVHASVGRNRVFTPLRVALVMGLIALIVGWLAKSPCIQTGANGELDQGGQRPWITGCYNDIVPLYASRGLDDPSRNPYAFSWVDHGSGEAGGRVFPRSEVHQQGEAWVAIDGGTTVGVGPADLVGDEQSGYSQVVDGALVPAPASAASEVRHLEYPVLTGYFMWGASALTSLYKDFTTSTGILPVPLEVGAYFTITAILLGLLYLWAIASTARIARRRIWDVAIMCLAPLLMVHAFTNWDLLAIGFTAGGMAGWARKRSVLAGVLLGLGTAAKLYPVLLLGPLLVLCLRSGRLRQFSITLVSTVVAWLLVNLPILALYPRAWSEFFSMNASRGPEWDSWYFLSTVIAPTDRWWSNLAGSATPLLNSLSLVLFLIACGAIGWLALSAARRPRFAQLAFLVILAFLLTNKVFSPQYSLWLLPLVVLALPRWRRVLAWEFAEVAVWFLLMLSFDTDAGKNLPIEPFAIAAVVRDALLIALAVRVIREILHPAWDLVRIAGDDDPSGGVLEGAPDRFTVPSLPALWRRRRSAVNEEDEEDDYTPQVSGSV
ncbi:MAG: hypothetical protein BGO26_19975 [Actinobacteria bacterium 69-20]|jgi:uncharacterized membrane protein|nr:DUF2029 domain-containing protein [Actinomycetota bacterium]OJV24798.1 MAG: hypothetical protein BGO26_19975 [Actinobacteria bacterium 69-20]